MHTMRYSERRNQALRFACFYSLLWKGCFLVGLLCCVLTSARSQTFESTLAGADQGEHAPDQKPHFFGEWGGERTKLLKKGVRFDLFYTSDSLWNIRSAKEERLAVFERVRGTVDLDFSRLTHTQGLFFCQLSEHSLRVVIRTSFTVAGSLAAIAPLERCDGWRG
jgi:carbohydrate-selective porin OprB